MTTTSRFLAPLARVHTVVLGALSWLLAVPGLLLAAPLAARVRAVDRDAGMSTAEYAVGTVAAVAFAAARKTTSFHVRDRVVTAAFDDASGWYSSVTMRPGWSATHVASRSANAERLSRLGELVAARDVSGHQKPPQPGEIGSLPARYNLRQ